VSRKDAEDVVVFFRMFSSQLFLSCSPKIFENFSHEMKNEEEARKTIFR
jgi:hypothetical protein